MTMKATTPIAALLLCLAAAPRASRGATPEEDGPKIIAEAFGKLTAALGEAMSEGGPAAAIKVCNEKAPQIAAAVGEEHGVTLRRATTRPRNPGNKADLFEQAVLKDWAAALEKGKTPEASTLTGPGGETHFFAPIVLANPLCLKCHGSEEKDIAPDTLDMLRRLYPDDQARGYQLGDLRGLWRVTFPAP
jgi:hypothetical protein